MKRIIGRLTALQVKKAMKTGRSGLMADGGNLYLQDGASWQLLYELNGRRRYMGLGPAHTISLAEAREKAREGRRLLLEGTDPLAAKRASRAALAQAVSFTAAAKLYIEAHRSDWSQKHLASWRSTTADVVRSGEVIGAKWTEINLAEKLWIIPGARTKTKREHRVPLSDAAVAILNKAAAVRKSDFVFPGLKPKQPLNSTVFLYLRRAMGRHGITTHGFRSSFRDWAGDCSAAPREVCEAALGHAVGNEAEQAYRRSDALQKRRHLMDAWAAFCENRPAEDKVVQLRSSS